MHCFRDCFACSSYDTPTQKRRKKTVTGGCMKNQNKATPKCIQGIDFQSTRELLVVLDQTIVDRYFKAKSTIDKILRPEDSKCDYQGSYLGGYERVNLKNYDEPFQGICTQTLRKSSTATTLTSDTLNFCMNAPDSSISIKDEILDRKSSIALYDDENLVNDADVQMFEIPLDSNIVLNPMNSRVSISQLDPSFEADVMNANDYNSQISAGPKYVYNPMNNIVTLSQTNDDSDGNNNDQPSAVPADVQFAPGEYIMEDSFLNDNYNVVNTFALEPIDMDSNQNVLSLIEPSSKEQNLTIQLVNTIANADSTSYDVDLPKYEKIDVSEALIDPFIKEQESTLHDEADRETKVKTEVEENTCAKCNKKFKMLRYLRKHELTCGMNFYYNCLFCAKSSMLSHTIKCHMTNRHAEQVAIYGMKELMENVIKRRKENKELSETNSNVLLKEENKVLSDVKSTFVSTSNLAKVKTNNKRKQTFPKERNDYIFEVKKEMCETSFKKEPVFPNVESSYVCKNETDVRVNFKPSKEYVDALCSNCNVHVKNLKSGTKNCCPNCQSPLIYKCVVCRKCFSKYLSICGHVKYHPQSGSRQIIATDDKHYCGYCSYETVQKSHLLRHLLGHSREKPVKIKREYSG